MRSACPTNIITALARQAYRRPVTQRISKTLAFYEWTKDADFESEFGQPCKRSWQAPLSCPLEQRPPGSPQVRNYRTKKGKDLKMHACRIPELPRDAGAGQERLIWVTEASLVGAHDAFRLVQLADQLNARVVFSGDRRQHKSATCRRDFPNGPQPDTRPGLQASQHSAAGALLCCRRSPEKPPLHSIGRQLHEAECIMGADERGFVHPYKPFLTRSCISREFRNAQDVGIFKSFPFLMR